MRVCLRGFIFMWLCGRGQTRERCEKNRFLTALSIPRASFPCPTQLRKMQVRKTRQFRTSTNTLDINNKNWKTKSCSYFSVEYRNPVKDYFEVMDKIRDHKVLQIRNHQV
jgi:hypothetical protein